VILRLSDEDFYKLTPRQFYVLLDQHDIQTQHTELLFAQITSAVINWSFSRPKVPATIKEFMPTFWNLEPKPARKNDPPETKVDTSTVEHHQNLASQVRMLFNQPKVAVIKGGELPSVNTPG
jgi:hypothetical protein